MVVSHEERPMQRFRSLSTCLPDVDGNSKGFHLPFNAFSNFNPIEEEDENDEDNLEANLKKTEQMTKKGKFRRLVKSIILQNRWSKLTEFKVADKDVMTKLKEMDDQTNPDVLTFNPSAFRSSSNAEQILTSEVKLLTCKPPWKRTDEELLNIYKSIDHMTVFKKYPQLVKQELARSLHYEEFEDGRIIIQQGHIGMSLYFIVKGSVAVEISTVDKETGTVYKQIVNEIMAGGSFGEMALMGGVARSATCICVGHSEFLRIDKNDFQEVLMRSYQKEWERKKRFMTSSPIFDGWSIKELRAATSTTTITEYLSNKVIVEDLQNHKGNIYIIMSGTCMVISKVKVIKEKLPYGKHYLKMISSHDIERIKTDRYTKIVDMFLVIRKLGYMDCFGTGENLKNTSVISMDRVEVLAIPTVHLLRHARGQCLEQLRMKESKNYPTLTEAFKNFISQRKWNGYKEELKNQILSKRTNKYLLERNVPNTAKTNTSKTLQSIKFPRIRQTSENVCSAMKRDRNTKKTSAKLRCTH